MTSEINSTHKVEVVPVKLEKHPNADRLSLVRIWGYVCCVETETWKEYDGKMAAYIPPDSTVPIARPEFGFLIKDAKEDGRARIKAKKLRGIVSFGLLVPAPEGSKLGDDVAEILGVEHYEPPMKGHGGKKGLIMGGDTETPPPGIMSNKYDVESFRRWAQDLFQPGEPIVATEKIHGAHGRYVYTNGKMYCGSRAEWKKEYSNYDHVTVEFLINAGKAEEQAQEILEKLKTKPQKQNMWWQALDATPGLREWCKEHPDHVVHGEVYGAVQDLNYGHQNGKVSFAAFDIRKGEKWLDYLDMRLMYQGLPMVPLMKDEKGRMQIPFNVEKLQEMAEGPSTIPGANHIREGIVIKPVLERWSDLIGRVQLKLVGAGYFERS